MGKKGGKAAAKKLKQHRDKDVNNKAIATVIQAQM